jgi:two-component system OmpR family response regulator
VAAPAAQRPSATTALLAGADDVLLWNFTDDEALARVLALLRRHPDMVERVMRFGALELDSEHREVRVAGTPVRIGRRRYRVLEMLMARRGSFTAAEDIVDAVAPWDEELSQNAIEVQMYQLRKMLAPFGLAIRGRRGLGYRLELAEADAALG